jgi:FkbM family methyltransferase
MKLKELFYMIGLKPKVKSFDFDVVDINYGDNQTCEWALWSNPKCPALPRVEDYDVLKLFLKLGDFAIDLGAHVGDTTLPMALCVGKEGLALALEPNPATFKMLKANSKLNQELTNIIPINAAAMSEDGDYVFQYNEASLMNGGYQRGISRFKHASFYKIDVQGLNLSQLLTKDYSDRLKNLKFIKTDLEGGDYTAFLTIKDIVIKYMPIIQSEINGVMTQSTRNDYIEDLKSLGYQIFSLNNETLDSMQNLTQTMIDSKDTFDIFAIPENMIEKFNDLNIKELR